MEVLSYCLDYNHTLNVNLAVDVKNVKDVIKAVVQGDIKCALINPRLIVDIFQVVVAANKAIVTCNNDKLITKSVYTEVIYNLSPSKNITAALKEYGVSENDTNFLVCTVGSSDTECAKMADDACKFINGTFKFPSSFELKNFCNETAIIKQYKITTDEMKVSNLLDSVVTRICNKGFK